MQSIKKIKQIGKGKFGMIYLVEKKEKQYALKSQKISKKALHKNTIHPIWREIEFHNWINKLDDDDKKLFSILYKYKFYDNVHDRTTSCVDMLINLKDGTIHKLLSNKLSQQQKYSIIIQCLYILQLIHKNGYYHCDVHPGNLMFTKCENDVHINIKIDDNVISLPTFGYIISLIDYGLMLCDKFELSKVDKIRLEYNKTHNNDLALFTDLVLLNGSVINRELKDKNIKKKASYDIIFELYKHHKKTYYELKKLYISKLNPTSSDHKWFELFEKHDWSNPYIHKHIVASSELVILLKIYHKKLYCQYIGAKFIPNFIENDDIGLIKINALNDQSLTINALLDRLL